jgi:hypothetical protein
MSLNEQNQVQTTDFKITAFVPYVGSVLIFLGTFRLMMFYNGFGISIIQFLDFTEIITSFLDILILSVILLSFAFFQNFLFLDSKTRMRQQLLREEILKKNEFLRDLKLYFKYFRLYLIASAGILLYSFISYKYNNSISLFSIFKIFILLFIIFLLQNISLSIDRRHVENKTSSRDKFVFSTLSNLLFFVVVIIGFTQYQIHDVIKNHSTNGTTITLDDNTSLESNNTNYYIGKTLNYVFYYHEKTKSTDIIPMTRVKQISIKNKEVKNHIFDFFSNP